MRETITFSAPRGTRRKLDAEARRRRLTRSSILLEMFRQRQEGISKMPPATRQALADARAGRVYRSKNLNDFFRALYR